MLPAPIKRRIKALKQLQAEIMNNEGEFYKEMHALEAKYYKISAPLYEKRGKVIAGSYEPNDDECIFPSDVEDEILKSEFQEKVKIDEMEEGDKEEKDLKGIPDFWLTIFKNVNMLAENVQEHDEPILKHLMDVTVVFFEDPMAFTLEFHFSPNEYFSNAVLTKEYFMKCTPDKDDPFSFEGPEIYKTKGCKIDWKKGKNVTVKTVKKSQKHKSRGSTRTVTKTVPNDSFFNFFNPPIVPDGSEADEDIQTLLNSDYEIGHYIRERIVPRAVLYFTGEAMDDEDEDYDEEDDDDDDDDDNMEDDDDREEANVITEIPPKCPQQ